MKTDKKQSRKSRALPFQEFCGIKEHPETTEELRRASAANKWRKKPGATPTFEQIAELWVTDRREMAEHEMASPTYAMEIITGPDANTGGTIVNFARFIWQGMPEAALTYLPHGCTRQQAVEWLEECQRFLVQYWGVMIDQPVEMSCMVYEAKKKNWNESREKPAEPVKDDDPNTWPSDRWHEIKEATNSLGFLALVKMPDEALEAFAWHWLKSVPEKCRDILTFLRFHRDWLDRGAAGEVEALPG